MWSHFILFDFKCWYISKHRIWKIRASLEFAVLKICISGFRHSLIKNKTQALLFYKQGIFLVQSENEIEMNTGKLSMMCLKCWWFRTELQSQRVEGGEGEQTKPSALSLIAFLEQKPEVHARLVVFWRRGSICGSVHWSIIPSITYRFFFTAIRNAVLLFASFKHKRGKFLGKKLFWGALILEPSKVER